MATRVETPYTQRARYYSSLDGFNIQKPAIPAHVFVAERDRAFDPATATGLIPCDLSRPLGGTLYFAGEATAPDGRIGTVDGAIASGQRAAQQVRRARA